MYTGIRYYDSLENYDNQVFRIINFDNQIEVPKLSINSIQGQIDVEISKDGNFDEDQYKRKRLEPLRNNTEISLSDNKNFNQIKLTNDTEIYSNPQSNDKNDLKLTKTEKNSNNNYVKVNCLDEQCYFSIQLKSKKNTTILKTTGKEVIDSIDANDVHRYIYQTKGNEKKIEVKFNVLDILNPIDTNISFKNNTNPTNSSDSANSSHFRNNTEVEMIDYKASQSESVANLGIENYTFEKNSQVMESALRNLKVYFSSSKKIFKFDSDKINEKYLVKPSKESQNYNTKIEIYPPEQGFFIFEVNNPLDKIVNYGIQVVTDQYRTIQIGEYVIDYITLQNSENFYEFYVKTSGNIYLKYSKCLGNIDFFYKTSKDKEWTNIINQNDDPKNDDFEYDILVEQHGFIYLKIKKEQTKIEDLDKKDNELKMLEGEYNINEDKKQSTNNEFDINEYNKMNSVYSFQVNYKSNSDLKNLKDYLKLGSDGEIDVQLGAYPLLNIDPISIDKNILDLYDFKIAYNLAMSDT